MQNKTKNIEKPNKYSTTTIVSISIFIGLLFLIIIIYCGGFIFVKYFNQQKSKTLSNTKKWQQTISGLEEEPIVTVPTENQEERKQNIGKLGQTISNEIVDLQVVSFEKNNLKSIQPAKDNEFYKIDFSIKNNTDQDQKILSIDLLAKDPEDGEFTLVKPSQNDNQSVFEDEINLASGQKKNGSLIFEINKNVSNIDFIFDDEADTKILIKLEK